MPTLTKSSIVGKISHGYTSKSMNLDNIKKKFEEQYFLESDAVFRFCFFRVSNREVSLDLVQEVFMRYWDALSQNKVIGNDRAYLFTISRNLIIDYYRKKKAVSLDKILEEVDDGSMILVDHTAISEVSVEARYVSEKINELPETDRQVVYLRFIEGLKPKEIAEVLKLSSNVVSVRLNRALEKLREIVGIDINEDE